MTLSSQAILRRKTEELRAYVEKLGAYWSIPGGSLVVVDATGTLSEFSFGHASFFLADQESDIGVSVLTNISGEFPAAQIIARVAHQLFSEEDSLIPSAQTQSSNGLCGEFFTPKDDPHSLTFVVRETKEEGLTIESGSISAPLFHTWFGSYVMTHKNLRTFRLSFSIDAMGPSWTYGSAVLRPTDSQTPTHDIESSDGDLPIVGHYRSYSPWFSNFRVFARAGNVFLVAPGGVEAPSDDVEMVEMPPGQWRLGSKSWLPERITEGPKVNNEAIFLVRGGVTYSRTESE